MIRTYGVYACASECQLHAARVCAGVSAPRTTLRLRSCVRIRCTEDSGYRADPHDNRVPPGSSFLEFYPTKRFPSMYFRIIFEPFVRSLDRRIGMLLET